MLCLFASTATLQANIIRGRVLDAETGEPLEGAQVHVNEAFEATTFFTKVSTDSLGYFHYRCGDMGRLTFTAKYFGYHDGTEKTIGIEGNDTIRLKEPAYTGALSQWSDQWLDWYHQLHDILRSYGYGGIYMPVSAELRNFDGSVDAFLAEFDRFLDAYEAFFGWRPFPCEEAYQEGDFVSLCFDAEQLQPVYERETNKLSASRRDAITKDLVAYYVHRADLRTGMQLYNSIGKICDTMYYQLLTYDHAHYRYNSAFRGLTFGVTMCQGYSEIFQLFAEYCGFQSVIVEGSIRSEAHAWNKVTFSDGTIRYVDVTNLGMDYLILVPWSHMAEIGFKLK